jgi:hypothetical protein
MSSFVVDLCHSAGQRAQYMVARMKLSTVALAVCLLGLLACGTFSVAADTKVPPTPAPIKGIVAAHRFTLEDPYQYTWTRERVMVSSGTLVVLEVDPALVVPRNTLEPVLYAGNVPLQRLNHGDKSGRVIGIVPGNIDVTTMPIWFGTPQLPERVTTAMAETERERAQKAGVTQTFERGAIAGLDSPPTASKDLAALLSTVAADLVLTYSPEEKDLAESWRLPVAKKAN